MTKFLNTNKGFIILCIVFSVVNKFPIISFGNAIAWVLFFAGIYYKEKATMEFYKSLGDFSLSIYADIFKVLNHHLKKSNRLLKVISNFNISDNEVEMVKKLYQIRRLSYKVMAKAQSEAKKSDKIEKLEKTVSEFKG